MTVWQSRLYTIGLVLNCFFTSSAAFWPFPETRFKSNSLIDAGPLGLEDLDGRVVAFGDFDGDQFLDIVSLSDDQRLLRIHRWDHASFRFKTSSQYSFAPTQRVQNVVPGDFNRDGMLDLLVMSNSGHGTTLDMKLYAGSHGKIDTSNPISLPPSTLAQPIPLDASGKMKIDLLGTSASASTLSLWNNSIAEGGSPSFNLIDAPLTGGEVCRISNPHSNAIVDFDGDCLADIFLLCDGATSSSHKTFQIWINEKEKGFTLAKYGSGTLPLGIGAISFADMNRDGTIDMIFPTCSDISLSTGTGTDCSINIIYNKQKPLCASASSTTGSGTQDCRAPDALCSTDPNFSFDFHTGSDGDTGYTSIPLSSLFPEIKTSLLLYDTSSSASAPIPISLRTADLDLDGFPDLIPIIVTNPGSKTQKATPVVLKSVPCPSSSKKKVAGCGSDGVGRTFEVLSAKTDTNIGLGVLEGIQDARGVAVLDLDEDGTLDIMVQRTGAQTGQTITFIQNNWFHDAFFLKAIVLNGACPGGWCSPANSSEPRYHPFGVSYSGPSYKYTVLDTSGKRAAAQVPQIPQTSYHALQTPYAFFGLGRTNNYIENLFVGGTQYFSSSSLSSPSFINMEGVIPNSKVVITPGESEGDEWRRELYLRPGRWIFWVVAIVIGTTIGLAGVVVILHVNEKREDEMERRRKLHHINFDAL